MFNRKLLIVLGIIVLALAVTALVLFLLHKRHWPVKFSLKTSASNVTVDIYANDMIAFPSQKLQPNVTKDFSITSDNVLNQRTQKPVTRDQLQDVIIYLPVSAPIQFASVNLPTFSVTLSKDRPGYSVIGKNDEMCPPGTYGSPEDLTDCIVCPAPGTMPPGCTTWQDTCMRCGLEKVADLRDGNWTQAGYYHVSFPQGIPLF